MAGPAANGVLAALAWAAVALLPRPGLERSSALAITTLLLYALAVTNAFVALTNVLPGLPLDGGRLLEAVVWRLGGDRDRGTIAAAWAGRCVAVGVPVVVLGWPLLHGEQPSWFRIIWVAAIGALLWAGAGAALADARIRRRTPGATVAALARPAVAVPADATLAQALAASAAVVGGAWVVLVDGSALPPRPTAVLDPAAVAAVPEHRRASTSRRPLPHARCRRGPWSRRAWRARDLLRALSQVPAEEWVVLDPAGRVVGLLLAREVVAAIMGERAAARA